MKKRPTLADMGWPTRAINAHMPRQLRLSTCGGKRGNVMEVGPETPVGQQAARAERGKVGLT